MNEIKITTELCEEDRKRLDDIAQGLGYLAGLLSQSLKGPAYKVEQPDPVADLPEEVKKAETPAEVKAEDHPVENPFTEAPAEPAPEQNEPTEPAATKDDVRKLFVKLAAAGKKEEARDIVTAFASSITELPDEAVAQVYVKLAALGD